MLKTRLSFFSARFSANCADRRRVLAAVLCLLPLVASAAIGPPEKEGLKFGFIKLTDMAPLAIG